MYICTTVRKILSDKMMLCTANYRQLKCSPLSLQFSLPLRTHKPVKCSLSSTFGRRQLQLASAAIFLLFPIKDVRANELPKALNKKKLDPLETYVPAIILCQAQFKDIDKALQSDKPKYVDSRSLLRSGPASSLRINIRAVAQYASEAGNGKVASDAVDECLSALEDLDSLLLRASRDDLRASTEAMKIKVNTAVVALDRLLQTVPSSMLDKGKAIARAYRETIDPTLQQGGGKEKLEPDIKLLEEIL
ncbi:uncharacterized protein LOC131043539 isoform X2 [Cryptomeria japonica]|uniref:uncharacterized protein LOC131043539 isoform X2 n=1 Tax=Cryptomeria japonica TaxID=3369 RepID=UPI0027D9F63D|nr:uncharacterized protein LOC131043539 isoform X2 [Cryptomeria japonica]